MLTPFGEVGQFQARAPEFVQSAAIPNFPAIFPPSHNDPAGSVFPVPGNFGARRTSFNLVPGQSFFGLVMVAAIDDVLYVQPTGINVYATLGLLGGVQPLQPLEVPLPAGWVTTTEIVSL
jgi:hypothetical protein